MLLQQLKQLATPAPKIVEHKIIPFERLHGVDQAKIWADDQQTAVPLTRDYMFKVENKLSKILSEEV